MLSQVLDQNPSWRILSKAKLVATLKAKKILFSHSEVDEHFKKSTLNQIFKRPRPINPSEYFRINALPLSFQIDIVKLVQYKSANKNIDQLLLLVDILSRKAFAYILPSGTMADVLTVYKTFVEQKCPHILSVSGDDFFSAKAFVEYNREKKIQLFTSVAKDNHAACGGNKLGIIDRLVRTLKSLIEKRAMSNNDPVWTGYLDEIIGLYNSTPHGSLHLDKKMWSAEDLIKGSFSPDEAFEKRDFLLKLHSEYMRHNAALKKKLMSRFTTGDKVRVLNPRYNIFAKEGERYSREIWTVVGPDFNGWKVRKGDEEKKVMGRDICKVEGGDEAAGPLRVDVAGPSRVDVVVERSRVIKRVKEREGVVASGRVEKGPIARRVKPRVQSGVEFWEGRVERKRSLRDRERLEELRKNPYWVGGGKEK